MTDHRWKSVTVPSVGEVWTIVVAAGTGSRFGGPVPKQFLPLGSQRVLDHSLELARRVSGDRVVLVTAADRVAEETGIVVAGGKTRSDSVRAGLAAVPSSASIILIHDAARPLVPDTVVTRLLAALADGADGAVPGLPVTDTVKRVDQMGRVIETPDRSSLMAVQTPQAFRASVLRAVHAIGGDATDDAGLLEAAGHEVIVVPGDPLARKVTTDEDLIWLAARLVSQP